MNIDWNILWTTVLTRATERSTWLGVIALLAAFGVTVAPEHVELICGFGSGLPGVILVASRDPKTITVNPVITIQAVDTDAFKEAILAPGEAVLTAPRDKGAL